MPWIAGLLLTLLGPGRQDQAAPRWEALPPEQHAQARAGLTQRQARERDGALLQVAGGQLTRSFQGQETKILCTLAGGPGEIFDLAADPAGLIFVAAEHGLFVLGPEVLHLDPIRLGDGFPPGRVRSVHVDSSRRLWLGTETSLGVVDPSFFWGRTFEAADGLPEPGPYRVTGGGAGSLLVECATGVFRYRVDVEDKNPLGEPSALPIDFDSELPTVLEPSQDNSGGVALWRLRLDRHHVTRDLSALAERASEPGRHRLELLGYSRDLALVFRREHEWTVPYPLYYSQGFVVIVGCLAALSAFLFFRRRQVFTRAGISTVVLLALVLQVLAGLIPHAKGWPFVGFGMYSRSTPAHGIVTEEALYGMVAGGRWRKLEAIQLGVAVDSLLQVIRPLVNDGPKAARAYAERWEGLNVGQDLRALQVQVVRKRQLPTGPVAVAPLILLDWREERDG